MFAPRYKAGVPSIDEILSLRRYKLRKTPHFQRPNPPLGHVPSSLRDHPKSVKLCPSVSIMRNVVVGPRSLTRATEQALKSLEKKSACGLSEDVKQLC